MAFNKLAPAAVGLTFIIALVTATAVGALVPPPRSCTRECGGVEIPYPFGIDVELGCQASDARQGFKLACRDMHGGRGRRLYYYNNELLDVSLEKAQVRWLNNISSYCYDAATKSMKVTSPPSNVDLEGSVFRPSPDANRFTVLGCKTLAYIGDMDDAASYTAVCGATCKDGNPSLLTNGSCDGMGCCRTAIPKGLENYRVWFDKNFSAPTPAACCSYAALIEASNFTFSSTVDLPLLVGVRRRLRRAGADGAGLGYWNSAGGDVSVGRRQAGVLCVRQRPKRLRRLAYRRLHLQMQQRISRESLPSRRMQIQQKATTTQHRSRFHFQS